MYVFTIVGLYPAVCFRGYEIVRETIEPKAMSRGAKRRAGEGDIGVTQGVSPPGKF